eukprot:4115389-Karenia_brevis.AAC.1
MQKRSSSSHEGDYDPIDQLPKRARPEETAQASSSMSSEVHGGDGEDIAANLDPEKWQRFQARVSAQRAAASQPGGTDEAVPEQMQFGSLEADSAWASQGETWGSSMDILLISSGESAADIGGHVSEVYSPPRIAPVAHAAGMSKGWSLDLTTADDQGRPWDFDDPQCRDRARELVDRTKPALLVGSPMCT